MDQLTDDRLKTSRLHWGALHCTYTAIALQYYTAMAIS